MSVLMHWGQAKRRAYLYRMVLWGTLCDKQAEFGRRLNEKPVGMWLCGSREVPSGLRKGIPSAARAKVTLTVDIKLLCVHFVGWRESEG